MDNNIQKYIAFIKTVEMGSFTKAAAVLNYAQSSVSKMIQDLEKEPFILLERGGRTEVTELLERNNIHPHIKFTTWEDYAIMVMVEKGLGIGILPQMILQRIPYNIVKRPLEEPFYREIGLAVKNKKMLSPATQRFLEYLNV